MQTGFGPVANEHGRRCWQRLQIASGILKQATQISGSPSRPRRAIRRVRPHCPHGRCGRSWQRAQTGRWSWSRPATGLTTPQREQAMASWRRRHRGHTPPQSERVSGLPLRAHIAHVGSASAAPRSRSSFTSRPTTGGAPSCSASGPADSAAARSRTACGLVATAFTAARTASGAIPGTAAAAMAMICSRRHRGQRCPACLPASG